MPADPDREYPTLREPFTPTGEAFSVPLSRSAPEHPTLQEATMTTEPDHENKHRPDGRARFRPSRSAADPVSIGAGLVFFLLGGAYLLASHGHLTVNAGWTLSFLMLGLGLSGIVGSLLRARLGNRGDRDTGSRHDW